MLARVVQGIATGAALGAVGAGMLDLDKTRGPVANAITPPLGTAAGGLLAGVLVHYLPAPTLLVYVVLAIVFLLQALGVTFMCRARRRRQRIDGPVHGPRRRRREDLLRQLGVRFGVLRRRLLLQQGLRRGQPFRLPSVFAGGGWADRRYLLPAPLDTSLPRERGSLRRRRILRRHQPGLPHRSRCTRGRPVPR